MIILITLVVVDDDAVVTGVDSINVFVYSRNIDAVA